MTVIEQSTDEMKETLMEDAPKKQDGARKN